MKRLIDSLPYQRILHNLLLKSKQEHPNRLDLLLVRVEELLLIVRDECERSVKNQTSKVESVDSATNSRVTHEKQPVKKSLVEHMIRR